MISAGRVHTNYVIECTIIRYDKAECHENWRILATGYQ